MRDALGRPLVLIRPCMPTFRFQEPDPNVKSIGWDRLKLRNGAHGPDMTGHGRFCLLP